MTRAPTFIIPTDVVLLGAYTTDLFLYDDLVIHTAGGIENVRRNFKLNLDVFSLPQVFYMCGTDGVPHNVTFGSSGYHAIPNSNWCHVVYPDWFEINDMQWRLLRSKTKTLTVDVVTPEPTFPTSHYQYFDMVFCTEEQSRWLGHAKNLFIHGKDKWTIKYNDNILEYDTMPVDLDFSVGAGDTLVASVINNCSTLDDLASTLEKIEHELNMKLLDRQLWIQTRQP